MFKMLRSLYQQNRSQKTSRAVNRQSAQLEILEDRYLLAAVVWDGGGTTNNWSDAVNWDNDIVPIAGDDVTIDLSGTAYTVSLNTNIDAANALGSFTVNSSDVTFAASGRTFTVDGPSNVTAGTVTWANSVWAGNGSLTVGSTASIDMYDSTTLPSRIDTAIVNNGSVLIRGNTNEWTNSSIVNTASGTLTIRSDANFFTAFGDNWLYLTEGMVNEGLIELRNIASSAGSATRLHTGNGTLVNEVGATIRTAGNAVTTNHIMYAEIDNRGDIDFAATIGANVIAGVGADSVNSGTITNSGGSTTVQIGSFNSFDNSGTIDLSNSQFSQIYGQSQLTSTMTNSGLIVLSDTGTSSSVISKISALNVLTNTTTGDIVFDSGAGKLETFNTFNNSGDLSVVASRLLTVSNGTINNAAGSTFAGDGSITLVGTTMDVAGVLSTGNANYVMDNAIVQGVGTFINDSSVDMFDNDALPSRIDSAIVNNGTFLIRGNTNEWTSSSIVNSATGTLTIRSDANFFTAFGDNQLFLSDGMVNEGLIELRNIASSAGSATRLHTGNGTLVNEVGATIRTAGNAVTTNHIMYAEIDNRGDIDFAATIGANVIAGVGADSVNSGTITNSGGSTTVQIGSFNSFDNSGTIDLSNSRFSQIYGQSQLTSTITNSGLIVLSDMGTSSSVISKISALNVLTNTTTGDIVFDSGAGKLETFNTFNNSGDVSVVAGRKLTVANGTINSAAGSTFAGDGSITLVGTTMDIAGELSTGNANYVLDNAIVQGVGTFINDSSVDMFDNDTLPSRIDTAIINNGSFLIRGNTNEWTSSSIVNSATGMLTIRSDANFFTAFGDNQLFLSDGMVNEGLIELRNIASSAGSATRLHTGNGTLVNEVGATIRTAGNAVTTNHIMYAEIDNRGDIDFAATIGANVIAGVGADSVNSGTITNSGGSTTVQIGSFNSFDNSGTIDLSNSQFSQIYGQSQLTSTMTNSGLIVLSDTGTSSSVISKISALNVLTNTTTGDIVFDSGAGKLETFNTFNNSGDVSVVAGQKLTVANGTINSAAGSTFAGDGSITLVGTTMDVAGALSTGNTNYVLDNAIVQGVGTFINDSSVDMFDNDTLPSRIDTAIVNNGSFLIRGNTNEWTNSSILNSPTGTLTIRSDANFFTPFGDNWLYLTDGMLNEGLIELRNTSPSSGSATRLHTGTGTLVNEVGATIRTEGNAVSTNHIMYAEIDNRGDIDFAATSGSNTIAGTGAETLNSGTITNSGGAPVTIANFDSFENSGLIDTGAVQAYFGNGGSYTQLATGQLLSAVEAEFNNIDDVFGVGTIGTQLNAVTSNVSPGLSPGVLPVVGNFIQNTSSSLTVEIGGNTGGLYDQVNVMGTVTIGFNVSLNTASFGGYVPAGSDAYVVINNDGTDAVSGAFAGLTEGAIVSTDFLGSGETATITYAGGTDNNDVVINIVDITPPAAPTTPDLDTGSDSGAFSTDDYTNVVLPTFSGTAEAGSTVELFSDVAGLLGTVSADVTTGAWSLTSAVSMADGVHNTTATATDSSGNASSASMAFQVTIDTSNPGIPAVTAITDDTATAGDGITSDNTLVISGSADPGVSVEVFAGAVSIGSTTSDGSGIWSFDYSATVLADGTYTFTAAASDLAGNTSAVSSAFVAIVDTAAPTVSAPNLITGSDTGVSNSDDITADTTPTVSGTAEANSAIELFDGVSSLGTTTADGSGNWSFTLAVQLDGVHNLSATATDTAGNQSTGAILTITIDTTPPAAPSIPDLDALSDTGDSDVDDVTADNTPTIFGAAEAGSTVEVFDGATLLGSTTANGVGSWAFTTPVLGDGIHNLSANSTDAAGNVGLVSAALEISIDTEGPTVSIDKAAGQPDTTTSSPINFEVVFSEATTTFDSSDVAISGTAGATTAIVTGSGTTYNIAVTGMTEGGSVIIDVATGAASDLAGNLSTAATIIDNEVTFGDAVYDFSAALFAVNETDATHTSNVVEVSRSGNTSIATSVDVIVAAIGATAGTDFVAGSLTLNFAAGETSQLVPIQIFGDATVELNESIALSLTGFSGTGQAGVGQPTATLQITNDDSATVAISGVSQVETNFGQTAFLFNVTLSEQVDSAVSLQANTADSSATVADNDYVAIAGQTLNFAPVTTAGQQVQTISVLVNGDTTIEANEAFDLVFSSLSAGGRDVTFVSAAATATAIGTIENDDSGLAAISANVSTAAEGGNDGQFTISLSQPSDSPVDVAYSIGGTAGNGADYELLSGTTTFAANQTTATIDIAVEEDLLLEGSETVVLTLTSATGGISIGSANSDTATISDNEVVTVNFVSTASSLTEATIGHDVLLQLVGAAGITLAPGITVSADVVDATSGSAASGSDYLAFGTQTVSFGAGSAVGTTQTVSLAVLDNGTVEPSETIGVTLNAVNGPGATVGVQTAHTTTIVDNDSLTVEFSQATGNDLEANGGNLPQLLVTGDIQSGHSVTVDIDITGGTAAAGDFATPTTLAVGSGSYSGQSFLIPSLAIIDDAMVEADETIELGTITGSAVTSGSQATSIYTILDDDTSQSNDPPIIKNLTSSNKDVANKSDDGVVTINGTFDDINVADVHVVTVDWGDGSTLESIAVNQLANSFNGTHSYSEGGIYAITVTANDGNNGSDSKTTSAVVQGTGLIDGKLYVIGSNGHDWVKVREHGGLLHVDLWLKGHRHNHHRHWHYQSHTHNHFDAANVDEIIVITCDGHDGIDVWASSSIPVIVDAGNGHDSIWTAGGDDTVLGGAGNDYIRTYGGNDTVDAGDGNNIVHSGSGDDTVTTGSGNDCIHTESGDDVINSGGGNDWIHSGDGDDIIFSGAGNDTVYAGDGNDIVFGGSGNDHIDGGNGHDLLFGGAGKDYLNGGRGHDILVGGDGRDTLCGGKGNDLLIGGSLETDWQSLFDESLLDTAIAEWATGDLADTMNILGNVLEDNDKDYLFGQQGCDTFITGNRDRWRQ